MSGVTKKLISAAGGVAGGFTAIEDVFSTYLYTGNGSTQTITNGIALSEAVVPALTSHSFGGTEAEVDSQGNYFRVLSSQVIKWSSTGTFIWGKTLLSSSRFYQNIAIDSNDDVIVCQTNLATSQLDVYKFSGTDGTSLWKKTYSNVGDRSSIACFGTRIFIAGATGNEAFYGFLIEINPSNGSVISSKYHTGGGDTFNYDLAIDATNSLLYISGNVFLSGTIIKYDISGGGLTFVTSGARYYQNTTIFRSIAVDSSGDVYVTGQTGSGNENCVVKFNSSLTEQWRVFFTTDANGAADGRQSIAISDTGKVLARLGTYNSGSHVVSLNPSNGAVINNSYFSGVPGTYPGDREFIYRNGKFLLPTTSSLIYEIPDLVANGNLSAVPVNNTSAGYSPVIGSGPSEGINYVNLVGDVSFTVADVSTSSFTLQFNDAYEGRGGLVWTKRRNSALSHQLFDTLRGANVQLSTDVTNGNTTVTNRLNSFNVDGFTLGGGASGPNVNGSTYASWTFRKAPRFFDVVTYTGDGGAGRQVPHNLGVAPGMIVVKSTAAARDWFVHHRSIHAQTWTGTKTGAIVLNKTDANNTAFGVFGTVTDTSFEVSRGNADTNVSGETYVAYIFAHDPLGPSGDGSDGLIACGSFTGVNTVVDLGWEPQFLLMKQSSTSGGWFLVDNMRGFPVASSSTKTLFANSSDAEGTFNIAQPTSTGFINGGNGGTLVYIAIRRGPMRAPESGTEVFALDTQNSGSYSSPPYHRSGFVTDAALRLYRTGGSSAYQGFASRMTGGNNLVTSSTAAEVTLTNVNVWDYMNGWGGSGASSSTTVVVSPMFRRAPEFFDVVAYTGNDTTQTVSHNLGVAPELIIVKSRSAIGHWRTLSTSLSQYTNLNLTGAFTGAFVQLVFGNNTVYVAPTETQFTVGSDDGVNNGGVTYIAYLFATLAGVSKVGSYTGNGSSQTINCGFTTGARFILIKRTDAAGDWYVWDTARGIVSGNDPFLKLNSTAAEVTTDDSIDPASSGFIVNQTAVTDVNVNAASYIFYAVA